GPGDLDYGGRRPALRRSVALGASGTIAGSRPGTLGAGAAGSRGAGFSSGQEAPRPLFRGVPGQRPVAVSHGPDLPAARGCRRLGAAPEDGGMVGLAPRANCARTPTPEGRVWKQLERRTSAPGSTQPAASRRGVDSRSP